MPLSTHRVRQLEDFYAKLSAYKTALLRGSPPEDLRRELRIAYGELKAELEAVKVPMYWEQGGRRFPVFEIALEPYDPRTYRVYQKSVRLAVASVEEAIGRVRDRDLPAEAARVLRDVERLRNGLAEYAQNVELAVYASTRKQRPDLLRLVAVITPSLQELGLETRSSPPGGPNEPLFELALTELVKVPSEPVKTALDKAFLLLGEAESKLRHTNSPSTEAGKILSGQEAPARSASLVEPSAPAPDPTPVLRIIPERSSWFNSLPRWIVLVSGVAIGLAVVSFGSKLWEALGYVNSAIGSVLGWLGQSKAGRLVAVGVVAAVVGIAGRVISNDISRGWREHRARIGVCAAVIVVCIVAAAIVNLAVAPAD